jgi:hypothetical protein
MSKKRSIVEQDSASFGNGTTCHKRARTTTSSAHVESKFSAEAKDVEAPAQPTAYYLVHQNDVSIELTDAARNVIRSVPNKALGKSVSGLDQIILSNSNLRQIITLDGARASLLTIPLELPSFMTSAILMLLLHGSPYFPRLLGTYCNEELAPGRLVAAVETAAITLKDAQTRFGCFTEQMAIFVMRHLLLAVKETQALGFVHHNGLVADKIGIMEDGRIVLCGLEHAKAAGDYKPIYALDVQAIGACIIRCCACSDEEIKDVGSRCANLAISAGLRNLLCSCVESKAERRPSPAELLECDILCSVKDREGLALFKRVVQETRADTPSPTVACLMQTVRELQKRVAILGQKKAPKASALQVSANDNEDPH